MATEQELASARRAHAETELGPDRKRWFPNHFVATDAHEQARRLFVEAANDPDARKQWPEDADVDDGEAPILLYGRLMAKRGPFLVVQTPQGRAQAYFGKADTGDALKKSLKRADLGDHVLVEGRPMRTNKGDGALKCTRFEHLGKALLPPPEKWHGLKDVEKRYRERYVDLFANPDVAQVFRARARIVQALRRFLDERGFLEVETPLLHSLRGGATARPFRTHHNALDLSLYLRIAPELYLKRLLVGGYDRVYELGRTFRNEGMSTKHNPEFTMLELYMAYATYDEMMDFTVDMLRATDAAVPEWQSQSRGYDLSAEWIRIPMRQAITQRIERAGSDRVSECAWSAVLDERTVYDAGALEAACTKMGEKLDEVGSKQLAGCETHGERLFLLYELLVEPELPNMFRTADGQRSVPVFITEYPIEVCPLARRNDERPDFADRFELFVEGREVANAFSELNDPDDQASRFEAQLENRARGDEEAMDFDADYVRALSHGMPPAAGFGLGVDRLVMMLCDQPSIRDVLLFPLLRPEVR